MKKAFCVRDKVLVKCNYEGSKQLKGCIGTLVSLHTSYRPDHATVKFPKEMSETHSCSGQCPNDNGYYLPLSSRYLKVVRRRGHVL